MASADIDIDGVVSALLKEYGYKEPEPRDTDGAGNASAPKSARNAPDANILARLAERRAAAEQREEVYCEVCGLVRVKSGSAGVPACERCYKRMAVLREGRREAIEFYSDPRNTRRSSRRVKKYIQGILAANQGRDLEIREDDIPPRPAPAAKPAAPTAPTPATAPAAPAAAAPARAGRLSAAEILAQFEDAPAEKKPAAPAAKAPVAPAEPVAEKPVAPAPAPEPAPAYEPAPAPKKGKLAARKEKAAAAKAAAVTPPAENPPVAYTPAPAPAPVTEDELSIDELLARIGEFSEEEDIPVSRSERRQMAEASVSRIERRAAEAKAAIEAEISPPPMSPRTEKHSPEAVSRRATRPAAPAAAAPGNGKPSLEEMLTPIGGAAGPLSARDGRRAQPAAPAAPHNEPPRAPITETPRPPAAKPPAPPAPATERRPAAHTAPEATPPAPRAAAAPGSGKPSLEEMLTPIGGAQESGLSRRNRRKSAPESPTPAPRQPAAATPAPPARTERSAAPESPAPAAEKRPAPEKPVPPQPPRRTPQPAPAPAANRAGEAHEPKAAERSIDEILADIALSDGADIPTEEMLSRAERALQGGSAPRKESIPASAPAHHSRMAERRTARSDAGGAPPAPTPRQNERIARKAYRPAFALNRVCQACGADEWVGIDGTYSYIELCNNCERRKVEYKKQDYVDSFECPYCGGLTGTREENKRKFGVRCSNCGELTICFQKVDELMMDEKLTAALTGYAKALVSEEVTCPQCGSESITTGTKGIAFFGGGKPVNRCARCGFTWTPEWTVG